MTHRMQLTTDNFGRVTISYTDSHLGDPVRVTRTFRAPTSGREGYVWELLDDGGSTQPCDYLDATGPTLIADEASLPAVIRREYRRRVARERRDARIAGWGLEVPGELAPLCE